MSLISELKRRNVFKVAAAYLALGWVVLQVTDIVVPALNLPPTIISNIVYIGIVGFFLAVFLAWAYELTPEGLKPTDEVDEDVSIRATTGHKINRLIIGLMAVAIAVLLFDRLYTPGEPAVANVSPSVELENTIAVMPFADMSPDGSQEYFGDGMAEEILNVLTTNSELDVTSRTTAFSLKGENLSIPEIADRLDVNYIVEGSIRSDGNFVRVTAQLIDVANDTHLWSETFDREMQGVFAIQDEISLAIADALRVELFGNQIGSVPTNNMEAYDLYLQAIRKFDVPNSQKVTEAQQMLFRVIELDPEFASAWAALAGSYEAEITWNELNDAEIDQRLVLAIDAANKATLLDPNLVTAWTVTGNAHLQRLDLQHARDFLTRAQQLTKNRQVDDFGIFYTAVGWFDDAIEVLERAVELDPEASVHYSVLGRAYLSNGEVEKGLAALNTSIKQGYGAAHVNMALFHLMNGDKESAKAELVSVWNKGVFLISTDGAAELETTDFVGTLVDGYFDPDLRAEYVQYLPSEELITLITGSMLLMDSEHLTNWLADSTFNRYLIITYLMAPPFRDMLNQPAMKAYINSTGLPDFWRANKWPDFCRPVGDDDYECQDMYGNYP